MIDKNKIKQIFELYDYSCLRETDNYMVYSVGRNLYPGVEIVCFNEVEITEIDKLIEEFRSLNFSVRVCDAKQTEQIEDYLFDWFFQVEQSNNKIKAQYREYTTTVMRAYGIDSKQMSSAHYEYVRCPYTIEREYGKVEYNHGVDIITSLRQELDQEGTKLIIVEAPAGYGKTSTAMELLNSYSEVSTKVRPFYMELSRDRQAPTFYYLLLSQINKNFNVLLGDTIVMHNIIEGRIPLIIDGFDELLNEDIDKANAAGDKNKGKTMLQTIADLLNGNAKIVLTTRKTAILSGEDFFEWYEETVTEKGNIYILRYKLEQPKIEDWLDERKIRNLPDHIKDLSNPVILGYLHFLNDDVFVQEAQSDALVKSYITRLLTREIERQNLPFSDIKDQRLIYERQASAFAYDDITSDSRKNIKENILLLSSDIINKYATPMKDSDSIANSLTNHALLDRKGDNNIGFINDFVLGLFIGYALIDTENESLKDYYQNMSTRFIDKAIISMSACDETEREYACMQLEEHCKNLTSNLHLLAEIKLLHKTKSLYTDTYLEGVLVVNINMGEPSHFSNSSFVNCEFVRGEIDFTAFENCTFINCRFNQVNIHGDTNGIDFFVCLKDGNSFDPNEKEEVIEDISDTTSSYSMELDILKKYFPQGSKRRRMQIISRLKNEYEDRRHFKKVFSSLVAKGFLLTNGDQSHISDAGVDFLNKNR